ncbi:MAG TPA: XdhC family protein [Stellaceae bacterium]|nr:XdhC family protein [Stellaceae bacterium]
MKGKYLDAILAANAERRSVALATELKSGRQVLLDRERFDGDLELADLHRNAMRDVQRADRNITLETDEGSVFIQVFSPPGRCFVVGAVHIAQPLTQMLPLIDYQPIVIDPRESFCTEARFPGVQLSTEWPDEALQRLKPDHRSAVVTLTHDPKIDDPALEVALKTDAFYIGALGSRRTHAGRTARLKERGFTDAELSRIHAPVGLAIGAVSQAEVAISILAEMTQVLRQGDRRIAEAVAA